MTVINMECRDGMAMCIADNSIDAIVTDPPYGLSKQPDMTEVLRHWLAGDDYVHGGSGFMGKSWDSFVPGPAVWKEAIRCLKPGGWAVVFAGSRTQDLMALSLRLAGFEIMDTGMWLYGSGFPKSLDIGKAIDRVNGEAGRLHKFTEWMRSTGLRAAEINRITGTCMGSHYLTDKSQPAIPTPELWSILRPFCGPVPAWVDELVDRIAAEREVVGSDTKARSTSGSSALPTVGGETVYQTWDITAPATDAAKKWQGWGTALKPAYEPFILCRKPLDGTYANNVLTHGCGALNIDGCRVGDDERSYSPKGTSANANMIRVPEHRLGAAGQEVTVTGRWPANVITTELDEPWAKYFYCAKASKRDRDEGLEHMPLTDSAELVDRTPDSDGMNSPRAGAGRTSGRRNTHVTVKPTDLMRYLCRLVTPPGGLVMDPFSGSGSTGKAAALEGFQFVGFEMDEKYAEIANARIEWARSQTC